MSYRASDLQGVAMNILEARMGLRLLHQATLVEMMEYCLIHPGRKSVYLGNIEMFLFRTTMVIIVWIKHGGKKEMFWQGGLDMKTGTLHEVPVGKRIVVTP